MGSHGHLGQCMLCLVPANSYAIRSLSGDLASQRSAVLVSALLTPMLLTFALLTPAVLGLGAGASRAAAQHGSSVMTQYGSSAPWPPGPAATAQKGPGALPASAQKGPGALPANGDWLGALMRIRPAPANSRAPATVRARAAERLGRYGEPDTAVQILVSELPSDPPHFVRRAILRALARRGHPASARALCELFHKGIEPLAGFVTALAAVGNAEAARCLVRGLSVPALSAEAHRGLVRMGSSAVPFVLRSLSETPTGMGADRAVRILGEIGDPEAAPALVKRLSQGDGAGRMAAVQALATSCDAASAPAIAALLDDPSVPVARAALRALASCGGPAQAPAVVARSQRGAPSLRLEALKTLVAIDPGRAQPHLKRAIESPNSELRLGAIQLAVNTPRTALVPLLVGIFQRGVQREAAASCLARVPGAKGLRALLGAVANRPRSAQSAARAIAIGVRKWTEQLDPGTAEGARDILRALRHAERNMVLRALARDASVSPRLISSLAASDARLRASAALGIQMLGRRRQRRGALADALMRALQTERDAEAFRRQAVAAMELGLEVPLSRLLGHLANPATSPEAMLLAAESAARARPRHRRQFGRALRRVLRSQNETPARARAAAALALARMERGRAFSVLAAALSDASDSVRMTVVRALGSLGGAHVVSALRTHARVEHSARLRSLALRAVRAIQRGDSWPLYTYGHSELELRIRPASGTRLRRALLDIILPDGRWLRLRTMEGGDLILPGLPHGDVDVRIQEPSGSTSGG